MWVTTWSTKLKVLYSGRSRIFKKTFLVLQLLQLRVGWKAKKKSRQPAFVNISKQSKLNLASSNTSNLTHCACIPGTLILQLQIRDVELFSKYFNFNAYSTKISGGFLKSQRGFQPRNPSRSATDIANNSMAIATSGRPGAQTKANSSNRQL